MTKLIVLPKELGKHDCGDHFFGTIIKTKKGVYCNLCGKVYPEGITPLLKKECHPNGMAKKARKK